MSVELFKLIFLSISLFLVGLFGVFLVKKNIIIILMSIELILVAIIINFVTFSIIMDDVSGQVFSLFVLTVAASESAIGLAILVVYYRIKGIICINFVNTLKA